MEKKEIRTVGFNNSANITSRKVAAIYEESNYGMFETFKSNRFPDHSLKIQKNIEQNGYIANPLLTIIDPVTGKYIIVDGFNRFNALKTLELPIHFTILDGATEKDMITLNLASKNWGIMDYVNHYAVGGNDNYIKFLQVYNLYNKAFKPMTIVFVMRLSSETRSFTNTRSSKVGNKIQNGTLEIVDLNKSMEILDFCKKVGEIKVMKGNQIYNEQNFVLAVMRLFRDCRDFEPEDAYNALVKHADIIRKKKKVTDYAQMLEDFVNDGRKACNKKHYDI